jgi:hypothetical protein
MSSHAVTGAALPLELYEDIVQNGVPTRVKHSFQMTALSDVDLSEIDLWLQTRYIRVCRMAAEGLPPDKYREEIDIAQRRAVSLTAFSGEGARHIATLDGWVRLTWQSIKRHHPDVSQERIRHLLLNDANLKEATHLFNMANVSGAVTTKPKDTKEKQNPRRNRHQKR